MPYVGVLKQALSAVRNKNCKKGGESMLILFLGRSLDGILKDAQTHFPGQSHLVISRDNDSLQVPEGSQSQTVSQFQPEADSCYTVIANGGTSSQLVPVLRKLVETKSDFEVYDLQRDGKTRLW